MRYRTVAAAASIVGVLVLSACGGADAPGSSANGRKHSAAEENSAAFGDANLVLTGDTQVAKAGPGFPASYLAPYTDGSSKIEDARKATGVKYFNLDFVIANTNGSCDAKVQGSNSLEDSGWVSTINAVRSAGGDVAVSFGGEAGTELARACHSPDSLKEQYKKVIDTFNLTRVDFDIEGDATLNDDAATSRRNGVLTELQEEYRKEGKNLDVNFTLSVSPQGLGDKQLALLRDAKGKGLSVNMVNAMTMDYYNGVKNMGDTAIKAASAVHGQLKSIWTDKTDQEVWHMEGNTPMIGLNDSAPEKFSLDDARTLLEFARSKKIQQVAFWSLERDRQCASGADSAANNCSGENQSPWEFTRTLNAVTDDSEPPQNSGTPTPTPSAPATTPPAAPAPSKPTTAPGSPSASDPSGPFHITGQLYCESGRPIVGVWVQTAKSGDSRFAAWRGIGDGATADWWTDLPSNEPYSLHVGCGGTPGQWATENKTQGYSGHHNSFNCMDVAGDRKYGICTHR
ncbi:chitinase [Streptomyces sp. NPDC088560]|uniref:chitinase n=1 Tax=Streptomyces sp. NPDC088560 TaxID=3365868 RepID=UPI0037F2547E